MTFEDPSIPYYMSAGDSDLGYYLIDGLTEDEELLFTLSYA